MMRGRQGIQARLLALNHLSPELATYLEEIRAEKRVHSPYEALLERYIANIEAGCYDAVGRSQPAQFFRYFNAGEAAVHIFKNPGSIPRDFSKAFSAAMRERGFVNRTIMVEGRRLRVWEVASVDPF